MTNSLHRCTMCSSPVTDSIEIEIENHERVKLGKCVDGSWICNDCLTKELVKLLQQFRMTVIASIMNILEMQANLMYLQILPELMKPIYNLRRF